MSEKTEYAVLRFLDTNGYSHMISDYVQGENLVQYLSKRQHMSKKRMLEWIVALIRQAEQYYKWENGEVYGWFMPYSVIVTEAGEVFLLEPGDPANREIRGVMEKKSVRGLFVKSEHIFSQKKTPEDDAYGLGRTIQYVLAKCKTDTELTRREKKRLKHVIERCTQGQEMTVTMLRELREEVKRCIPVHQKERRKRKIAGIVGGVALLLIGGVMVGVLSRGMDYQGERALEAGGDIQNGQKKEADKEIGSEDVNEGSSGQDTEIETQMDVDMCIEAGLLYLYQMQEPEMGREYLSQVKERSTLAGYYLEMDAYMRGEDREDIRQVIQAGTEELEKREPMDAVQMYVYYLPILKAYAIQQEEKNVVEEIKICQKILKSMGVVLEKKTKVEEEKEQAAAEGKGDRWISRELEIRGYLANASERAGELEQTIREYEQIKEMMKQMDETDMDELEKIYSKLTEVYEEKELKEEMWENCMEAVEVIPDSEILWMQFIRLRCADEGIERTICAETVKKALGTVPKIVENQEFQKLQQEYAIRIEGEQIWVGQ